MKFNHKDYCTHVENLEDRDILTRKLFDVNMRLFNFSREYREVVLHCCDHIAWCAKTEKEGYKKPHGWSGANAGIPFNIIAVYHDGKTVVMINPRIIGTRGVMKKVKSNCGSLTLDKPREIHRPAIVSIDFFDESGQFCEWHDIPPTPGFTIQHEIQHNLGILIKDLN